MIYRMFRSMFLLMILVSACDDQGPSSVERGVPVTAPAPVPSTAPASNTASSPPAPSTNRDTGYAAPDARAYVERLYGPGVQVALCQEFAHRNWVYCDVIHANRQNPILVKCPGVMHTIRSFGFVSGCTLRSAIEN